MQRFFQKKYISISQKFNFIVVLIIVIIMILFSYYLYNVEKKRRIAEYYNILNEKVEIIAANLSYPLWEFDYSNISTILRSSMIKKDFFCVILYDLSYNIIKMFYKDNDNVLYEDEYSYLSEISEKQSFIIKKYIPSPYPEYKKDLGFIVVYSKKDNVLSQIRLLILNILIETIIIIIILMISISLIFKKYINRPINLLINALNEFAKKNFYVRININTNDEFQMIGNEFNKMAEIILNYTNDMNRIIEERTNQIVEINKMLKEERDQLNLRNKIIEKDLDLARKIQKELLPKDIPLSNISYFYESMDKVGGDFFDIVDFKNNDKYGIFLSDVSGHGVPAAFITAILKTLLHNARELKNPILLMKYLNEKTQKLLAGNFATALYGIYSQKNKTFKFVSAGHNMPILIDNNGIILYEGIKSVPLGILKNEDLVKFNRDYRELNIDLSKYKKMLLYTDGLIELTSKSDDITMYGNKQLFEDLNKIYNLKSYNFINELYRKILEFRKDKHFEDDICFVCIDFD